MKNLTTPSGFVVSSINKPPHPFSPLPSSCGKPQSATFSSERRRNYSLPRSLFFLLLFCFSALLLLAGCNSKSPISDTPKEKKHTIMEIDTLFDSHLDSLEYVINNVELSSHERLNIYEKLSWSFSFDDLEKTLFYSNLGLDLLKVEKNDSLKVLFFYNMAVAYTERFIFDSAKLYLDEALKCAKKIENEKLEASIYHAYGRLYSKMGNDLTSLEYKEKVVQLAEKNKDYNLLATVLCNIGVMHYNNENFEQAEKYLLKGLEIYQTNTKNPQNQFLSQIYSLLSRVYLSTGKYDQALENAQKALEHAKSSKIKYFIVDPMLDLAKLYSSSHFQEYDKALEIAIQALSLAEETGTNFSIGRSLHVISDCYRLAKNFSKGKTYAQRALDLSNSDDLIDRKLILRLLTYNLIGLKETEEAFSAFATYDSLSNVISEQDLQSALSEFEIRYETEKKQLEIEKQQQVIKRHNMQRWFFVSGIALSVVILALLYFLLRVRTRQKETLAEMNSTKDKFFTIISHDLKNPAVAQREALQMLLENAKQWDAEKLERYYHGLMKSADGLVDLLYNLLNWAQLQTGRMPFKPVLYDIAADMRENTLSHLKGMAEHKGIELVTKLPDSALVTGDINMLKTVVRNLIDNAIKFTPKGGTVTLEIAHCTGVARNAPTTRISISDTGTGMTEEQICTLSGRDVARNVSTRGTANETGTGLGLTVCKELLEKHGSKLQIESEAGKGSTFWFEI